MNTPVTAYTRELKQRRSAPLAAPTDLSAKARLAISPALNAALADVYALYLKTRNFQWRMSGPQFRDWQLMLDEQATQRFAMTDPLAARCRKLGGPTLRAIGQISRTQRVLDNDAEYVAPEDMLAELRDDNQRLAAELRQAHETSARRTVTSPVRRSWRPGSTRPNGALGSCSRPRAALAARRLSGLGQCPRRGEFRCQSRRRRGVWLAHPTSRQRRMAPKISPALRVDPEWG